MKTLTRVVLALLAVLMTQSCKTTTSMEAPVAEKKAKELTMHGDTRVDNYYWLRERENPPFHDLSTMVSPIVEDLSISCFRRTVVNNAAGSERDVSSMVLAVSTFISILPILPLTLAP